MRENESQPNSPHQSKDPSLPTNQPLRDIGSSLGMKLLAVLMRIFPLPIVYWTAMVPVIWYYLRRPEGRLSSATYQRMLGLNYGPVRRFLFGLSQARAFSHVILDNMYLGMFGPERFQLKSIGIEVFLQALDQKKGLILVSAHVGNWHLAVNFLNNTNRSVHLVIDDVRQTEVQRQMDAAKASAGHLFVHDANKGPELVFELRAALNRGEVVILDGDRAVSSRRIKVPFLGGQAWFPTTAFSIAAATGAPVCAALVFRTGNQHYECYGIGPLNDVPLNGSANRRSQAEMMARRFAGHLETYVRRFPKQWFNFFDFWRE